MKKIIEELNEEHLVIDEFMSKLESSISGSDYINHLLELDTELRKFTKEHLKSHHQKEEKFVYRWMSEQNKNSDKDLIKKMITDHEYFETKGEWIIKEIDKYKVGDKTSLATLGLEISEFVNKYKEHLNRETEFIFFIADGLKIQN